MESEKKRTIETPEGTFVGTVEESGVISFKGIPFAKPPVGDLRWQPPQPMDESDYIMPADKYPPAPIQPDMPPALAKRLNEAPHTPQSEDCLYLNMWCWDVTTPKKAVLFWIYGGSYTIGHASRLQERGERFVAANHDIVVVACNYRLGVFGSLNLSGLDGADGYAYSCNLNLLDQRAALNWVRRNADAFGGDVERITLYGHSAGSNAISHHLAMEQSSGLFQRAICQSSFLVGHGTVSFDESRASADKIFAYLGVTTLEEALAVSADALLEAQVALFGGAYTPPVDDGLVVFPEELERIAQGQVSGKEFLIGNSTGEYDQLFTGLSAKEAFDKALSRNAERLGDAGEEALRAYAGIHPELDEALAYATANNELGMTLGGEIQARACSRHNTVYKFLFAWADPEKQVRAGHGAPCPFFFGNGTPAHAPCGLESLVQKSWGNFIRKGDPNIAEIGEWRPYSDTEKQTMVMDASWYVEDDAWEQDARFWRSFFPEMDCIDECGKGE